MEFAGAQPYRNAARRRSWPYVLPLALPVAVLAGAIGYASLKSSGAGTLTPAPGHHGALVWGDAIFGNQRQIDSWLRLHGSSYGRWVTRHPAAAVLVVPVRPPAARAKAHHAKTVRASRQSTAAR